MRETSLAPGSPQSYIQQSYLVVSSVTLPRVKLVSLASKTIIEIYLSSIGPLRFTDWVALGTRRVFVSERAQISYGWCVGKWTRLKKDHCLNYEIIYTHLTVLTFLPLRHWELAFIAPRGLSPKHNQVVYWNGQCLLLVRRFSTPFQVAMC